ncbi:MAG: DUF3187 family protein [Deltaproteobacteria bacterium]|nr:DUF3187 family protein [Deltaproteobacteria bacterium]
MMKTLVRFAGFLMLLALCAARAEAIDILPFQSQNQSPLIAVYGLPALGSAKVVPGSTGTLRLTLDQANNYINEINAAESLVLDGESTRLSFSGRYGIGRSLELGITIPFVVAGGGFLDNFIETYHATFGFPNGGRELAPRNRLLYRYQKNGVTLFNMESSGQGPGDVSVNAGWQIYQSAASGRNLTLRASLKLPTGDAGSLRGSGSTDLAAWMIGDWGRRFSLGQVTLFGAAGGMGMTKGRVLADQQRPLVGFGMLGFGFAPADWIYLKVQTNAHTAFYSDSDLKQINAASVQLTMGGALYFTPRTSLDIGVTEDLLVGTSPDVVFHFSMAHTF